MNESDETLSQPTEKNAILQAIAELSKKIDSLENNNNAQFEAVNSELEAINSQFEVIREGIVFNNAKFDRLTAEVYESRADMAKFCAHLTELTEEVRKSHKSLV